MRGCALCKERARAFCESDQANLCWFCDSKVHHANFLVARHSRTLLCHSCHSLTPWKASGPNLCSLTVSFCDSCVGPRPRRDEGGGDHVDDDRDEEERSHGNGDGGDEMTEERGDRTEKGDSQVVLWSLPSSSSVTTPPPPASCSCSEEEVDDVRMPSPMSKQTAEDSADLPSRPPRHSPVQPIQRPASTKAAKTCPGRTAATSIHSSKPTKGRDAGRVKPYDLRPGKLIRNRSMWSPSRRGG